MYCQAQSDAFLEINLICNQIYVKQRNQNESDRYPASWRNRNQKRVILKNSRGAIRLKIDEQSK
tara:strand:- start:488 stop:679 length:192 start_codon:yes stop_codon:yes gene_type:complete